MEKNRRTVQFSMEASEFRREYTKRFRSSRECDRRVLCTGWSGRSGICDYYHQCSAGTSEKTKRNIIKYTPICGAGAAPILSGCVLYAHLCRSSDAVPRSSNGGSLLHTVTSDLLGPAGGIILGVAVLFACMTTSIGLTTSFADYFHELFPNVSL